MCHIDSLKMKEFENFTKNENQGYIKFQDAPKTNFLFFLEN